MENKKTIYLLLIILVIFAGFIYILIMKSNRDQNQSEKNLQIIQEQKDEKAIEEQEGVESKDFTVMRKSGIVQEVTETLIKIKDNDVDASFSINNEIPVLQMDESEPKKVPFSEIKKDVYVLLNIDEKTNQIISIQILEKDKENKIIF